ncbi:WGR domain-containing protein [Candidatus Uabimicrobium sp. HlEnr_7]|uniref:WGR domain-containing protein n=1 Tax=Candidatus Uabimicrobium helgolandensis TaxID=3095367 RepID=UPI0035578FEB
MEKYLECKDNKTRKFWEIKVTGSLYTIRYGRIGTHGRTVTKECTSDTQALAEAKKKLASKINKQYYEVPVQVSPTKAQKSLAKKKQKNSSVIESQKIVFREFRCETKTREYKFWNIAVNNTSQIVHYGSVGKKGQKKEKQFTSSEQVVTSIEKLIQQKIAKGYIEIPSQLLKHKRSCWFPITKKKKDSCTASKFGGTPWLSRDEKWPRCGECYHLLHFFMQINLAKLPPKLQRQYGDGLLQLFCCTNENNEDPCESWEPFSTAHLVRVITPTGETWNNIDDAKKIEDMEDWEFEEEDSIGEFPTRTIVDWEKLTEFPSEEDIICELNLKLITDASKMGAFPFGSDKLGGWPHWTQNGEYTDCSKCDKQMQLLFQLDSHDNIPYSFGDRGCGHITQCPEHKEMVAFGWASH